MRVVSDGFVAWEDYILYALLDFIVDNYAPVLGAINEEVETMEDSILKKELEHAAIDRLYMLRRDLLRLRNAAAPLLDVCQRLEHADVLPIDASMQPLFRDVTDHVRRIKRKSTPYERFSHSRLKRV